MFFGEDIFNWALPKCTLSKRSKINHLRKEEGARKLLLLKGTLT
jgi:hypothetical protein